jgi:hypothetical protein
VTPGLLQLLGAKPILGRTFDSKDSQCERCAVISYSVWTDQFQRDPNAIGSALYLNNQRFEVLGVLPSEFRFPGMNIGLFRLFGKNSEPLFPNFEWPGALVRVRPAIQVAKPRFQQYVDQLGDLQRDVKLNVLSFRDIERGRIESLTALISIAVLLVLAVNWRPLVRLSATAPNRMSTSSLHWWSFFFLKTVLLLLVVLITSAEIPQAIVWVWGGKAQESAGSLMMWLFLVGLTIFLTWSIKDQLARCRVCLKRLRTQVALGDALGPFSEPRGLDLLCDEGHGVLHVPVMQQTSIDTERWTLLDKSWRDVEQSA